MQKQKFLWDGVVRSSHWLVAFCFFANLWFTGGGSLLHQFLGYLAVAMIALRLLWSLSLARFPARFRDLIPTPAGIHRHFRELKQRREEAIGHNHWGLLAIWLMWFCLIALAISGTLVAQEHDWYYDYNLDDWHGTIAYFLAGLVLLHVGAVFLSSWWLRRNLLRSMAPHPCRSSASGSASHKDSR